MTAHELLTDLQRQGFSLRSLPDGKLEVKPASKLTDDLRATLKQHKGEVLTLLRQNARQSYRQAAESVREDCFAIDPGWLIDRHPDLWHRMATLDRKLSALEQRGSEPEEYRALLESLVQTVREARTLYERERGEEATQCKTNGCLQHPAKSSYTTVRNSPWSGSARVPCRSKFFAWARTGRATAFFWLAQPS